MGESHIGGHTWPTLLEEEEEDFFNLKSNKIVNITLASTLLHRLDTQCVQQMLLGQTSEQTFHILIILYHWGKIPSQ